MRGPDWTDYEDDLLQVVFPSSPWETLRAAFPQRTKNAINVHAQRLGIQRGSPRQRLAANLRMANARQSSDAHQALRRMLDGLGRVDPLEIFSDAGARAHVPVLSRQQRVA